MGSFSNNPLSETLYDRDYSQNNDDREPNHVTVAHLIAVTNRKVAQTSCTDCAGNRSYADKAHKGNECDSGNAGDGFS